MVKGQGRFAGRLAGRLLRAHLCSFPEVGVTPSGSSPCLRVSFSYIISISSKSLPFSSSTMPSVRLAVGHAVAFCQTTSRERHILALPFTSLSLSLSPLSLFLRGEEKEVMPLLISVEARTIHAVRFGSLGLNPDEKRGRRRARRAKNGVKWRDWARLCVGGKRALVRRWAAIRAWGLAVVPWRRGLLERVLPRLASGWPARGP